MARKRRSSTLLSMCKMLAVIFLCAGCTWPAASEEGPAVSQTTQPVTPPGPVSGADPNRRQAELDLSITTSLMRVKTPTEKAKFLKKGAQLWEVELALTYEELMAILPKKGQNALKKSQQAWQRFFDKQSALADGVYLSVYDSLDGGTVWLVEMEDSRLSLLRERAIKLNSYRVALLTGLPTTSNTYPDNQTQEQNDAAHKVASLYAQIGNALDAGQALSAYNSFRAMKKAEIAWLSWTHAEADKGLALHWGFVLDNEQVIRLEKLSSAIAHLKGQ